MSRDLRKQLDQAMETIAGLAAKVESLTARVLELEQENKQLKQENKQLKQENKQLKQENELLKQENKLLRQQNQELIRRVFGSSSETLDPDQLNLLECDESKKPGAADDHEDTSAAKTGKKKQSRLRRSMEDLPTTREVIEPAEVRDNPSLWKRIDEEVTEELHFSPASYSRHLIIRPKYSRLEQTLHPDDGRNVAIAGLPPRLLGSSVLTPSLLAGVATSKFCWHLPLYRQSRMMSHRGLECSRSLMCHWLEHGAGLLEGIYDQLHLSLLRSTYLQADETPIDYLDPGKGTTGKGYLWTLHNPAVGVYYQWHPNRRAESLTSLLGNDGKQFGGLLQHDAYKCYDSYCKDHRLEQSACMAHIRRRFVKALDDHPGIARWFLRQYARLYEIESELRRNKATPDQRKRRRQNHSRRILELLQKAAAHLLEQNRILPRSPLGKALSYAHANLPLMHGWLEHGECEIDNNLIENSIRPTKLGAKNWLFFGSVESGKYGAIYYTLIENVRRLGLDPYAYLNWVFEELRLNPTPEDWDRLLPSSWAATQQPNTDRAYAA